MKMQAYINSPVLDSEKVLVRGKIGAQVQKLTSMQKVLLQVPTWSDEDFNGYLERNQHFNHWRG